MSYMVEFPPRPLPTDITSPPYVIFGIQSEDVSSTLPANIPLAVVLHFTPKMRRWVLPPPDSLPKFGRQLALRKPYVGINILEPIDPKALLLIVNKMLQRAGLAGEKDHFNSYPAITVGINVLKAWKMLELPEEGIRGLEMHVYMRVMMGAPLALVEMQTLWSAFPMTSPILHEAAHNFIRSHINGEYYTKNYETIKKWICEDKQRKNFILQFEGQYKSQSEGPTIVVTTDDGSTATAAPPLKKEMASGAGLVKKRAGILERAGTRRVSPEERKWREQLDELDMKRRLRRLKSDESFRSIETAIYDPQPTESTTAEPSGQEVDNFPSGSSWDYDPEWVKSEYTTSTSEVSKDVLGKLEETDAGPHPSPGDNILPSRALGKLEKQLQNTEKRKYNRLKRKPPMEV